MKIKIKCPICNEKKDDKTFSLFNYILLCSKDCEKKLNEMFFNKNIPLSIQQHQQFNQIIIAEYLREQNTTLTLIEKGKKVVNATET